MKYLKGVSGLKTLAKELLSLLDEKQEIRAAHMIHTIFIL